MTSANQPFRRTSGIAAAALLAIGLISLHAIHLSADTPAAFTRDIGIYVDEGYKTLAARNLLLFGDVKMHPGNPYYGWIKASPVTHWLHYGAFQWFGVRVESARLVSLAFFAVLLFGYAAVMGRRYEQRVFLAGLIVLGLEGTLFFYSRVALIEIELVAMLCCLLYGLARWPGLQPAALLLLSGAWGALMILFVKKSAVAYAFPLLGAALLVLAAKRNWRVSKEVAASALFIVALGLLFLTANTNLAVDRIQISPQPIVRNLVRSPLAESSPIVVGAGLFCAVHLLLLRGRKCLGDPYFLSLASLVLISPILLAFVRYNPARYYVPILPAYVLLVSEWVQARAWKQGLPSPLSRPALFALWAGLCLVFANLLTGLSTALPEPVSLIILVVSLLLGSLVWRLRAALFRAPALRAVSIGLFSIGVATNAWAIGSFLAAPRYEADEIRRALQSIVTGKHRIAGDWAPFFALGTPMRALYLRSDYAETHEMGLSDSIPVRGHAATVTWLLEATRPDFFLHSSGAASEWTVKAIESMDNVSLGNPVCEGVYVGRRVTLYPLQWRADSEPLAK
jgi:hypothetical protein